MWPVIMSKLALVSTELAPNSISSRDCQSFCPTAFWVQLVGERNGVGSLNKAPIPCSLSMLPLSALKC